jgi:hypothetical protein
MILQDAEFGDIEKNNSGGTLQWRKRNIPVIDEAHNLLDVLLDFISINVMQGQ